VSAPDDHRPRRDRLNEDRVRSRRAGRRLALAAVFEAEFGTHAIGIARGSLEHHSQSRHRRAITKEPGGSVVLTDHHIQPTIVISTVMTAVGPG
jgi:hypothetical protein